MIFPTASRDNMEAGKYRLVPTLGARYSLPEITPGSWAAFLLRYDYDFTGESDRRHISELQLAPLVNVALPDGWFVNLYPSSDIRYNFAAKRTGNLGVVLAVQLHGGQAADQVDRGVAGDRYPDGT